MRPPDASEAPEGATDQGLRDENRSEDRTAHDPNRCATCLLGVKPWTGKRRDEALTRASGRRIIDLAGAS